MSDSEHEEKPRSVLASLGHEISEMPGWLKAAGVTAVAASLLGSTAVLAGVAAYAIVRATVRNDKR